MSDRPNSVLVLGATGTQGGAVARGLLAAGYTVQALVRESGTARAQALAAEGIELVPGDLLDRPSLTYAFSGADVVYAITTPFEHGAGEEERQGETIVAAATDAGLEWLVFASVAAAGRAPIPHFNSKWQIEQRLAASELAWTVIAPSYFYENVLGSMDAIRTRRLPMALPADKPLHQIALADLGALVATVLARPAEHLRQRVEIAGDDPTPAQMAAALGATYEAVPLEVIRERSEDLFSMYSFLSAEGYGIDVAAVRARYFEVAWTSFAEWASRVDI
jgi:uncharacterized protein YbjT (DUF2867 family)